MYSVCISDFFSFYVTILVLLLLKKIILILRFIPFQCWASQARLDHRQWGVAPTNVYCTCSIIIIIVIVIQMLSPLLALMGYLSNLTTALELATNRYCNDPLPSRPLPSLSSLNSLSLYRVWFVFYLPQMWFPGTKGQCQRRRIFNTCKYMYMFLLLLPWQPLPRKPVTMTTL